MGLWRLCLRRNRNGYRSRVAAGGWPASRGSGGHAKARSRSQDRAGDALAGPSRPTRGPGVGASSVPLPKPRPPEASATPPEQAAKPRNSADQEGEKTGEQAAPAPPVPSACRQALTDEIAIAPSIPDIHGPGACGGEDLVRLEAVVLPDKRRVSVKPAAILRCTMASAIADWIRTDMAPLASSLGTRYQRTRQFQFVRMPRPQSRCGR